jgi:hypothetical protein
VLHRSLRHGIRGAAACPHRLSFRPVRNPPSAGLIFTTFVPGLLSLASLCWAVSCDGLLAAPTVRKSPKLLQNQKNSFFHYIILCGSPLDEALQVYCSQSPKLPYPAVNQPASGSFAPGTADVLASRATNGRNALVDA